jgi:hypothetical protein
LYRTIAHGDLGLFSSGFPALCRKTGGCSAWEAEMNAWKPGVKSFSANHFGAIFGSILLAARSLLSFVRLIQPAGI